MKLKKIKMIKIILTAILFFAFTKFDYAQSNCGQAVDQLQNYAANVNRIYQEEYWQTIPNVRCPAFVTNQWGQPIAVNPQVVQNCRWQMLYGLNQWYGQQCNLVNNWYIQIMRGCATNQQQPQKINRKPAPKPITNDDESEQINTDQIEDLTAGIDEDKSSPIRIPKTPAGYKPN